MQQITLKTVVPLVLAGKLPLIAVNVDGESKQFLLDNGAPTMILNSKYNSGDGTPLQAFTSSGEPQNIQSKFISVFEWEDIRLENQLALVMDLSHFENDADTVVHGIIGSSVMMNYDLFLNYRNKQVGLLNLPDSPANLMDMIAPALIGKHQTIPLQIAHHFPLIKLKIGDKILTMALNMGSCVNTLSQVHLDYFKQQGVLLGETPAVIRGMATKKTVTAYPLQSAIIGTDEDIPIDGMLFAFDDVEIPGAAIDGMLGYELFFRADAIIRFNRRELLFGLFTK
jgi:hypothetical protein